MGRLAKGAEGRPRALQMPLFRAASNLIDWQRAPPSRPPRCAPWPSSMTNPAPLLQRLDSQHLAVLGHRAARHVETLLRQLLADRRIGQRRWGAAA